MLRKLLFIFVVIIAMNGYSQATAYPVPNIHQCDYEVFDLTVQNSIVLQNQSPSQFSVGFFTSQANATANVNAISNPNFFVGGMTNQIFIRVTNTQDNSFGITTFTASWSNTVPAGPYSDVTACDAYILPSPTGGSYYTMPNGGGTVIPAGSVITSTQTIYGWINGACPGQDSFTVTINDTPPPPVVSDIVVCDGYVLPALPPNQHYYTGPNGMGAEIMPNTELFASNTIYVLDTNGVCWAESSFELTVLESPAIPPVADVAVCDFYLPPALPIGMNYYTGTGGSGVMIPIGEVITTSQTIYIFAINAMCTDEVSFNVTIFNTPDEFFPPVYACTEYVLPDLPAGYLYATQPQGGGAFLPAGMVITASTTIYIYAETGTNPNCFTDQELVITIGTPTVVLDDLHGCDFNSDGLAEFTLSEAIPFWLVNANITVAFFETQQDAAMNVNPLDSTAPYFNSVPNQQTIFVRSTFEGGCFVISELQLVTIECSNNTISGTVSIDTDGDGCDASDPPLTSGQVVLTNGNEVTYAYINNQGEYVFHGVLQGDNYLSVNNLSSFYTAPAPQLVVTTGNNDTDIANFCLSGPSPVNDLQLTLSCWSAPTPGFQINYILYLQNLGTTALSGTATMTYDNSILNYMGSTPMQSGQTSNTIAFNFTNLQPSAYAYYNINFTVFTPPTVVAGDIFMVSATATTTAPDVDLSNNSMSLVQTVVNSYDPNDISVHEGPFITEEQADGYLHYTIRFQNSGTAPAVNVRLENTLDPNLDWSTFMPLSASHIYNAQRDGDDLTFRFNNIMLPAEQDDEPGSHGWITYKVKPVAGFAIGDVISNTADIFFDFNEAIVTNTVTTQIEQLSIADNGFMSLKMYPNPATDNVYFGGIAGLMQVQVYDVQGKMIKSELITANQSLDVSNVEAGMYFVKISADGKMVTKKLIVE